MRERGFSLIELLVIIVVMSVLLAVSTLQFNQYTTKANIESQARTMYADIMKARSEALLQKVPRSFNVDNTQLKIYPNEGATGTPMLVTTFKYGVAFNTSDAIAFDTRGIADGTKMICVAPVGNPAVIDSIIITRTMVQLGKWEGGDCDSGNVTAR